MAGSCSSLRCSKQANNKNKSNSGWCAGSSTAAVPQAGEQAAHADATNSLAELSSVSFLSFAVICTTRNRTDTFADLCFRHSLRSSHHHHHHHHARVSPIGFKMLPSSSHACAVRPGPNGSVGTSSAGEAISRKPIFGGSCPFG